MLCTCWLVFRVVVNALIDVSWLDNVTAWIELTRAAWHSGVSTLVSRRPRSCVDMDASSVWCLLPCPVNANFLGIHFSYENYYRKPRRQSKNNTLLEVGFSRSARWFARALALILLSILLLLFLHLCDFYLFQFDNIHLSQCFVRWILGKDKHENMIHMISVWLVLDYRHNPHTNARFACHSRITCCRTHACEN